jgi:hypothetical protein
MASTTQYESAQLILQIYDLRREDKMRESRDWWWQFNPKSAEDIMKAMGGPDGWKMRQSVGYWEMVCALVNHGAIDEQMFLDTNSEFLFIFAKAQPFLEDVRKADPTLLAQMEELIMRDPDADEKLESLRKKMIEWAKK